MLRRDRRWPCIATRWDRYLFVRTVLATCVVLALGYLLTAATDEGGVSWGDRAGRTLPLTPLCSAMGVWVAIAPLRARGEVRALEALGRTPRRIAAPAAAAGAAVALAAAAVVATMSSVSVAGFYPTAGHPAGWEWDGTAFVDRVRRVRIAEDGTPVRLSVPAAIFPEGSRIPRGRAAAALAIAMAGIATPLLFARALLGPGERSDRPRGRLLRTEVTSAIAATAFAAAMALVVFQAAAAGRVSALAGDFPPLGLLVLAVVRCKRPS